MNKHKLHYGWVVIFMGLLTTIAAHGFGRMAYTIILPAMKDGLNFNYTQLGLLGTGNFIGYLTMAIIGGFLAARFGTRIVTDNGLHPDVSNPDDGHSYAYHDCMRVGLSQRPFVVVGEDDNDIGLPVGDRIRCFWFQ